MTKSITQSNNDIITTYHGEDPQGDVGDTGAWSSLADKANKTDIPTEVDTITTTAGYDWSTSHNATYFTDNGEKLLLGGKPNSTRRKLVIIGSSVVYGYGATNLNGWARKLATTLQGRGWTVVNRGVPGDTTQGVINRWFTDLAPERPDFVLIGLSLGNENIQGATTTSDKDNIYNTYKYNLLKLITMVRQIGAVPIIASTYPRNEFSAADYEYCKQINREIEAWNVYQIDLMGNVDDGAGHYITGTNYSDGVHPNDTGHDLMYKGIPVSIFENLNRHANTPLVKKDGYISMGTDTTTIYPASSVLVDPFTSFTVFFKLRDTNPGSTKVFMGLNSANDARLRNTNNYLEYASQTASASIVSTLNIKADTNSHDVAVSFSAADNIVKLYVDGVLVGSCTDALNMNNFVVSLAGGLSPGYNSFSCDFKDLLIYRVRLNDRHIAELSSGNYLKSSLEIYSPLSDKNVTAGRRLVNLAPTNSFMIVNSGAWTAKTPIKAIS